MNSPPGMTGGPGSVVTIGSFDGVHIGHQRLLRRVRDEASARGLTAVAVTFDPHPRCVVDPAGLPAAALEPRATASSCSAETAPTVWWWSRSPAS